MLSQWDHQFPDCEPVAHWLRAAFPDRWVRFHSLPGSKRYPDDESEYVTVLYSHNHILSQLVGSARKVVLLTTGYSRSRKLAGLEPELLSLLPDAVLWRTISMHELDGNFDEPTYWHVSACIREWQPGLFDPVVSRGAKDIEWQPIVAFRAAKGGLFTPMLFQYIPRCERLRRYSARRL
jgi:hypothetical protein